ncbi:MAG: amidinotransferase [Candidatus Levybacteria bacterium]|nr:amidinotransferase [Candidatus Levybacteria bacterium]
MNRQSTNTVVLVSPDHFGFNPETAQTNPFMHTPQSLHKNTQEIRDSAVKEFKNVVAVLKKHDVRVLILPNRKDVVTPDAVFPNNWFSHHSEGQVVVYPMLTANRRLERQKDALVTLLTHANIPVSEVIDLTSDEENGLVLEATGSMVLDRVNKVAFAMASSRTNEVEFKKWCTLMGYEGVYIITPKYHRQEVYHTNLLMSIGTSFAVVCLEVIEDDQVRRQVKDLIEELGKEYIEISLDQVYNFCGNILEVQSTSGEKKIVMSEGARDAFTKEQLDRLAKHGEIVSIAIPTIEEVGGGGVRCMIAEVFANNNERR